MSSERKEYADELNQTLQELKNKSDNLTIYSIVEELNDIYQIIERVDVLMELPQNEKLCPLIIDALRDVTADLKRVEIDFWSKSDLNHLANRVNKILKQETRTDEIKVSKADLDLLSHSLFSGKFQPTIRQVLDSCIACYKDTYSKEMTKQQLDTVKNVLEDLPNNLLLKYKNPIAQQVVQVFSEEKSDKTESLHKILLQLIKKNEIAQSEKIRKDKMKLSLKLTEDILKSTRQYFSQKEMTPEQENFVKQVAAQLVESVGKPFVSQNVDRIAKGIYNLMDKSHLKKYDIACQILIEEINRNELKDEKATSSPKIVGRR